MATVTAQHEEPAQSPRGAATRWILLAMLCIVFCGFSALGVWQLHRLQWKLELIQRVDSRIHAEPVSLPPASEWLQVTAERDEYRHVRLEGHFIARHETRVQALTVLGAGFWVMSPFQLQDGSIVLVNRGFAPAPDKGELPSSAATVVTGLLRMSEPGGGFLRNNAPADDRWYSRDVAGIAGVRGLVNLAPFFIDADAQGNGTSQWPRGGLTVTRFSNNHLGYALTWFALALLSAWAVWRLAVTERRSQRD
jgi:surfeit locus 1 family protein